MTDLVASFTVPDETGRSMVLVGSFRLDLTAEGKTLARDLDLAEMLGFERPRKIREIIKRYQESGDLGAVHVRPVVGRTSMPRGGERETAVDEFWLTEEQALFIVAKSETPRANEMLREVIAVFVAVRRGLATPAPSMLAIRSEVDELRAELAALKAKPTVSLTLLSTGNGTIVDPDAPGLDPAGAVIARWALKLTAPWEGTGKDLLVALSCFPPGVNSSRGIEPALVRNKQALEAMGVEVEYLGLNKQGRNLWRIGGAS